jgi:DNA polymerase-3 subunit epsilon/CBS domain-containing protein
MGIVTERDILRAFAANALAAQTCRVDETMSSPLSTVDADDFLYRALGRIDRLGIRHLPVVSQGQIVGMVTPRNLLKRPLTQAFDLGDEIASANTVSSLARAKAKITPLSSALLKEGLDAADVGAVIAEELCALTARAAVIAEQKLLSEGKGSPPAPYALLVLGSVGRGESLLSADQDNALIYREGGGNDAEWFALFGKHISDALDEAGVPYCNGGVMVKNAAWRHTEAGWRDLVESWLRRSNPQDLLNVDIFFDATVAHGDRELGRSIRAYAYERAGAMPLFLKLLAETSRTWAPPLSMFGQLRADEKGRVDLKKGGLFPLCAAVRTLAIKHGVEARSTAERLDGLRRFNLISNDETDMALIARRTFMSYILTQQIADMNNGIQPSSRIELARLSRSDRAEVVRAMKACEPLIVATREGLL